MYFYFKFRFVCHSLCLILGFVVACFGSILMAAGLCDREDYRVARVNRVGLRGFAELSVKSESIVDLTIPFVGCQRTYDFYDCYYENKKFKLTENVDNGLGEHGGFSLAGCAQHWVSWTTSDEIIFRAFKSLDGVVSGVTSSVRKTRAPRNRPYFSCKVDVLKPKIGAASRSHAKNTLRCDYAEGPIIGTLVGDLSGVKIGAEPRVQQIEGIDGFSFMDSQLSEMLFESLGEQALNDSSEGQGRIEMTQDADQIRIRVKTGQLKNSAASNQNRSDTIMECTKTLNSELRTFCTIFFLAR